MIALSVICMVLGVMVNRTLLKSETAFFVFITMMSWGLFGIVYTMRAEFVEYDGASAWVLWVILAVVGIIALAFTIIILAAVISSLRKRVA